MTDSRQNSLSAIFCGLGTIAFFDEVVFHQLLHWHHFYDLSTTSAGLVSDGLFHAFSWSATVAGLFLLANLWKKGVWQRTRWLGYFLVSVGLFQLYDGLVQHKLLGLHQIRYGVDLLPYDLAWNGSAVVIAAIGVLLIRKAVRP
ncbi:DUF2243 domain-containing protein [Alkalicoccus urumqiensis]|uniref:DUF2243 domain-containing protein n=1 Tax=Alkalicoccus urumqiensis TaxID=1548213 RepID=A0A2P6MLI0_ALKUR|nr:DUF2243 domain-containing protein [Alkalicoccus urumqiensis]PRO67128.1 DUF2243 domain-containing protein [Alkalicoccus urumqiensis]